MWLQYWESNESSKEMQLPFVFYFGCKESIRTTSLEMKGNCNKAPYLTAPGVSSPEAAPGKGQPWVYAQSGMWNCQRESRGRLWRWGRSRGQGGWEAEVPGLGTRAVLLSKALVVVQHLMVWRDSIELCSVTPRATSRGCNAVSFKDSCSYGRFLSPRKGAQKSPVQ